MAQRQQEARRQQIYRFPDLKPAGVPFCIKHLRTMESCGTFPLRIQLSEHTVGWVADEVDAWVADKIAARRVIPLEPRRPGRPPTLIGPPDELAPPPDVRRGRPRKPVGEEPPAIVRRGPGRPRKVTPAELAPAPAE